MASQRGDNLKLGTITAPSSLASYQYCCVEIASTGITLQASAGGAVDGILQNAPAAGEAAEIVTYGATKALAGDTVLPGAKLMVEATTGRVVTASEGSNHVIGKAITGGADGEVIDILFAVTGKES